MRYIIVETHTDECTFSFDEPIPIEYESGEALICDFMDAAMAAAKAGFDYFKFIGAEWRTKNYVSISRTPYKKEVYEQYNPEVLTIDEWFERNALKLQGVTTNQPENPKLVQLILALERGWRVRKQITDSLFWELWLTVENGERTVKSAGWKSAIEPACKPFCHMVTFPEEWEILEKPRSA